MEKDMKKLAIVLAATATMAAAAPAVAQEAPADPFVATQGVAITPLVIIGGAAVVVAVAAASGTN